MVKNANNEHACNMRDSAGRGMAPSTWAWAGAGPAGQAAMNSACTCTRIEFYSGW